MSADLTPFDFRGTRVRVVTIDGEPWFVGGDVCFVLGYRNSRDAVAKHVRPAQRGVSRIATPSGEGGVRIARHGDGAGRGGRRAGPGTAEARGFRGMQADRDRADQKRAVDTGRLTELPQSSLDESTGERVVRPPQVRVTVKGIHELHRRLGGSGPVLLGVAS